MASDIAKAAVTDEPPGTVGKPVIGDAAPSKDGTVSREVLPKNVHHTNVDIKADPNGGGPGEDRYIMTIHSQIELVDAFTDQDLGEKDTDINVVLSVKEGRMSFNGVKLNLDVVNVNATATFGFPNYIDESSEDDLKKRFDQGVVGLEIKATTNWVENKAGADVKRVAVHIKITEIDGQEVTHRDIIEEIFDIHRDGTFKRWRELDPSHIDANAFHHASTIIHGFSKAFDRLTPLARFGVIFGFILAGLLILVAFSMALFRFFPATAPWFNSPVVFLQARRGYTALYDSEKDVAVDEEVAEVQEKVQEKA